MKHNLLHVPGLVNKVRREQSRRGPPQVVFVGRRSPTRLRIFGLYKKITGGRSPIRHRIFGIVKKVREGGSTEDGPYGKA